MKRPELFTLETEKVSQGSYKVVEMPIEAQSGDTIRITDCDVMFEATGSLGEDLAAAGVMRVMWKHNMKVGILYNPKDCDNIKYPIPPDDGT